LPVTAYRLGAVITLAVAIAFSAQAEIIAHRNDFPAGEATPPNGSFSIRFPIPYNVEHKGAETRVGDGREAAMKVHMLTGVDREGLRFSATETPLRQPVPPIDRFLETSSKRPDAVASDVRHGQRDDLEILFVFAYGTPVEIFFPNHAQQDHRLWPGCPMPH
jgi:hypothetical protein